eukprot:m.309583 g.309583  ORF g.309583 m.309583 type:complete len:124 (-) comp19640_c2_seq19:34-405(-)
MTEPQTTVRGGWVECFDREGVATGTVRAFDRVLWATHPPTAQQAQPEPLQRLQDDGNAALPTCIVPVHGKPCGAKMRWCLMQERPLSALAAPGTTLTLMTCRPTTRPPKQSSRRRGCTKKKHG